MTEIDERQVLEDQAKALSEAMFRAAHSDPNSDATERAWIEHEPREGYHAERVLRLLHEAGWVMIPADVLADFDEAIRTMKADRYLTELVQQWRDPERASSPPLTEREASDG